MIVAQIELTTHTGSFSMYGDVVIHRVDFETLGLAMKEYERIASLIKRKHEKANDLPREVSLVGVGKVTVPFDSIHSVGVNDFAKLNAARVGTKDAFPLVFDK